MTFRDEGIEEFKKIFKETKNKIRNTRGCIFVELLEDMSNPNVFITYSVWSKPEDLERYRHSELFKDTWAKAKALFSAPPEVHSLKRIEKG